MATTGSHPPVPRYSSTDPWLWTTTAWPQPRSWRWDGLEPRPFPNAAKATAESIADSINQTADETAVRAQARTEFGLKFQAAGCFSIERGTDGASIESAGVPATAVSSAEGRSSAVAAINAWAGKTGISVTVNAAGDGISLTNDSGKNTRIREPSVPNSANGMRPKYARSPTGEMVDVGPLWTMRAPHTGDWNGVASGDLVMNSDKSFALDAQGENALLDAQSTLRDVARLDVTSFSKAADALQTVDATLSHISCARAKLGALRSRCEVAVSNFQVASENMAAVRSRERDADCAAETAQLARSQILQPAGTAVVAQAKQLPQGELALLR